MIDYSIIIGISDTSNGDDDLIEYDGVLLGVYTNENYALPIRM